MPKKYNNEASHCRIYVGNLLRLNREKQLEICNQAIDGFELPDTDSIYEHTEFDLFVRNLRGDEVAVVAKLISLAETKPKQRPGIAFFIRLLKVVEASSYILDAETGITSLDGSKWYQHIVDTHNTITQGRFLASPRAKKMAEKSHSNRPKGLANHWKSKAMKKNRERMAQHWRDPAFANAEEAIAACPDPELRDASKSLWIDVFGNRKKFK